MEAELKAIWEKYAVQREDERAVDAMNAKREEAGLPRLVMLQYAQSSHRATVAPPRYWRDDMDDALLAVVKRYLDPVTS